MPDSTSARLHDRAAGALLGAFIGDALALGPHWYYNLDELRADFGEWITGYTDPRPGRYHAGLKAGDPSQAGILLELTLRSLVIFCGAFLLVESVSTMIGAWHAIGLLRDEVGPALIQHRRVGVPAEPQRVVGKRHRHHQ